MGSYRRIWQRQRWSCTALEVQIYDGVLARLLSRRGPPEYMRFQVFSQDFKSRAPASLTVFNQPQLPSIEGLAAAIFAVLILAGALLSLGHLMGQNIQAQNINDQEANSFSPKRVSLLQMNLPELWTEEQKEYFTEHIAIQGIKLDEENIEKDIFEQFQSVVFKSKKLKELKIILQNLEEVEIQHWMGVVKTRCHAVSKSELKELLVQDGDVDYFNEDLNRKFLKDEEFAVTLLPLVDLMNHYQPKDLYLDQPSHLNIQPSPFQDQGDLSLIISLSKNFSNEEVGHTYNVRKLDPLSLFHSYGFTIENNPFSYSQIVVKNIKKHLNELQLELCVEIGCFQGEDKVPHQQQITFLLDISGLSQSLIHFLAVKSLKKMLAKSVQSLDIATELYKDHFKQLETKVTLQYLSLLMRTFSYHTLIKSDIDLINSLKSQQDDILALDENLWDKESKEQIEDLRRKSLVHELNISHKQVVQLHKLYAMMRGLRMIMDTLLK